MIGLYSCSSGYKSLLLRGNRINKSRGAHIGLLRYWTHQTVRYTVYHPEPNVATVSSYLTVSHKWTSSVRVQHSGCRVNESVWVSLSWKRRRCPPLNLKDAQQKGVLFQCFFSCLRCNTDSIQFRCLACVSPEQSVQRLSPAQTLPSAPLTVWHSRPLRNTHPLFFFTIAL